METKRFYTSKTFWFNLITVVLAVAVYFGFQDFEPDAKISELATVIVAVINIVLRFLTNSALK